MLLCLYLAVSEFTQTFRSLQITGVRCGFRGTNVSLCVSVRFSRSLFSFAEKRKSVNSSCHYDSVCSDKSSSRVKKRERNVPRALSASVHQSNRVSISPSPHIQWFSIEPWKCFPQKSWEETVGYIFFNLSLEG